MCNGKYQILILILFYLLLENNVVCDCFVSGDIAFKESPLHIDNLEYSPTRWSWMAIDGNLTTCSMTAEANSPEAARRILNPFWKVWLRKPYLVRGIIFQTELNKTGICFYIYLTFFLFQEQIKLTVCGIYKNNCLGNWDILS